MFFIVWLAAVCSPRQTQWAWLPADCGGARRRRGGGGGLRQEDGGRSVCRTTANDQLLVPLHFASAMFSPHPPLPSSSSGKRRETRSRFPTRGRNHRQDYPALGILLFSTKACLSLKKKQKNTHDIKNTPWRVVRRFKQTISRNSASPLLACARWWRFDQAPFGIPEAPWAELDAPQLWRHSSKAHVRTERWIKKSTHTTGALC